MDNEDREHEFFKYVKLAQVQLVKIITIYLGIFPLCQVVAEEESQQYYSMVK